VAKGGRGSGKSHFLAGLLIEDSLAEPGENGGEGLRSVCIREVQQDLSQSSKLLLELKLRAFGLGEPDGFKVFRDVIQTPGDGLIIFKGMNNYNADSIKSLESYKRAWWEEAHGASKDSINLLRPTMRAVGSQLWWSYNQRLRTDPVDMLFTGDVPTGAKIVAANWRDNPWFTPELEQERLDCLRLQPDLYPHIWEGEYVKAIDGAYYAASLKQAELDGRIGFVPVDPNLRVWAFWDIGGPGKKADAMTIVLAQFVGLEIRVLDYIEGVGQVLGYYTQELRSRGWSNAYCVLPHDAAQTHADNPTGMDFQAQLEAAGFQTEKVHSPPGIVMQRIATARKLFPRIRFNKSKTEALVLALGWYHERLDKNRAGGLMPEGVGLGPDHDWSSHAADAFGLMCIRYEEPATAINITMPKMGVA
jgi:phage terminase large subunit